ncbi:AHH domain-containing protein [Hyalangium versicolor]|uniref:AHH domain-containing protein n=1 Tax=Hyalangium versicolor TaxID=2861190 RepID=UPI001CCB7580|nr:AHH domain-containing protein [Hyalangium versicolor]
MELNERVNAQMLESSPDTCPFCNKARHELAWEEKGDPDQKIVSRPSSLNCPDLPGSAPGAYGRARHHIVPAIQCFAVVKRFARMALLVGYNINDPKNGISLPTVKNPYQYNGRQLNYGDLPPNVQEDIANKAMKTTGGQWHVGHHEWKYIDELEDEGEIPHEPYNKAVIQRLIDEAQILERAGLCEEKDDPKDKVRTIMENISNVEIRDKLKAFAEQPTKSAPYYVSYLALKYAYAKRP